FQAEDGIRDRTVTGVQTCALPIWLNSIAVTLAALTTLATRKLWSLWETVLGIISCLVWLHRGSKLTRSRISTPHRRSWRVLLWRSEERRVGKECRSRGSGGCDKEM